jgi:hypothetical protein
MGLVGLNVGAAFGVRLRMAIVLLPWFATWVHTLLECGCWRLGLVLNNDMRAAVPSLPLQGCR